MLIDLVQLFDQCFRADTYAPVVRQDFPGDVPLSIQNESGWSGDVLVTHRVGIGMSKAERLDCLAILIRE